MVDISHKRIDIRRQRVGLDCEGARATTTAANVDEAVQRLREVEGRFRMSHGIENEQPEAQSNQKEIRRTTDKLRQDMVEKKLYKDGRLAHRPEPELKTHTSYLVFAILPREWSADDEEHAAKKWPLKPKEHASEVTGLSRKQIKRAEKEQAKQTKIDSN
jgi:tRNA (adenine57-N1/adenine58-N1)-methyltransferase